MLRCAVLGCTNEVKYRLVVLTAHAAEKETLTSHVCPSHLEEHLNFYGEFFLAVVVSRLRTADGSTNRPRL